MLDTENDRVSVGSGEQKSGPYGQYGQFGQFAHAKFNFDAFDSTQLAFKKVILLPLPLKTLNFNVTRNTKIMEEDFLPSYIKIMEEEF